MYNTNPPTNNLSTEYMARVFRAPVTSIIGTLDLLRDGIFDKLDDKKKAELLNNAYAKAKKLNEYINYSICNDRHCMDNTCKIHFPDPVNNS
ncbi:MAG: hypothetical protein Q7S57_04165 [bacterium]|nr:hypothetical protein [bacterium]